MNEPLVSVVLLCYNQAEYVAGSIQSVLDQTYPNIELIIVDDASVDSSDSVIRNAIENVTEAQYIHLVKNIGNCKAFNAGFKRSKGEYIIDLAADDHMHSDKIQKQVDFFSSLDKDFGVVYSDANLIDENNLNIGTQLEKVKSIGKLGKMPSGIIFKELIRYFFIASPTQMIKREVFEELNGYDENLSYEDFDFWIRSARKWKYGFQNAVLMTIRKLPTGMSSGMYHSDDRKVQSTMDVCRKIMDMVESRDEEIALLERVRYETRMAWKYRNRVMFNQWYTMLRELNGLSLSYRLMNYTK